MKKKERKRGSEKETLEEKFRRKNEEWRDEVEEEE